MKITRGQFLKSSLGLVGAAAALGSMPGCGGDDGDDAPPGGNGACSPTISANHSHTLSVPRADVDAAVTKVYSIQGGASHDHKVTLFDSHFATLKGGGTVTVNTETGGVDMHVHSITVKCA